MSEILYSAFTPTNNTSWLGEAYKSLLEQTDPRWEWVLVPNGPNVSELRTNISYIVKDDPRVKVYPAGITGSVGALKQLACLQAKGSFLVELDHDDLLAPDCFERINMSAKVTDAGFIYSDWSGFRKDGSFETFKEEYGWNRYSWKFKDRDWEIMRAFEPSARSICEIYFAPNHVRAWSREAYEKTGGYDPSIKVADDHDLVCRTYLAGVQFSHINAPLYMYRIHDSNTVKLYNQEIQAQQAINRDKYIYPLIAEECKRRGLPVVDLGSSAEKKLKVESIRKLGWTLPFKDDSVGTVRAVEFLQFVPRRYVKRIIREIYRILVPGGWFTSSTPSTDGRGAFQDPRHQSWWNEGSWWYWTKSEQHKLLYPDPQRSSVPKFQAVRLWTHYPSVWHRSNKLAYVYADLCALKGQGRQPGQKEILR